MVRSFEAKVAKREEVKLKIGLVGPSGSGKSLSSLLLAYGITKAWNKIAYIDTENNSALFYVNAEVDILKSDGTKGTFKVGEFTHIPFSAPHYPDDYTAVIDYAESLNDVELIIIDSVSPEWAACLDLQVKLGGKYQDWSKITPLHEKFVNKILQSPKHIIVTMRAKQDFSMEQNEKGRTEVKKLGLKAEQRDNFEYELGLNFAVDMNHKALASKDRTGLFDAIVPFQITPAIGDKLIKWSKGE
jgi:ABC-type dipeptide/oligopeptide/nickel transport system ATPase component